MITCTRERLASSIADVCSLLPAQHAHTGDATLPVDPMWRVYESLERIGRGALFMARDDNRAVGYAAAFLHPHLNSQRVMVGTVPTYFVEESPNRGVILVALLRNAIEWLQAGGAQNIDIDTEYRHSAGEVLERMGFIPVKVGYRLARSVAPAQLTQ